MNILPSRRTVVSGAAWSLPAIAASAAVPAAAVSRCIPEITHYWGGLGYHWGQLGEPSQARTTQVLSLQAGEVVIENLPPGVTVDRILVRQVVARREGQRSPGPGYFYPANPAATFARQSSGFTPRNVPEAAQNHTIDGSRRFTVTTLFPAPGSGYDPFVKAQNTAEFVDWLDGVRTRSWTLWYSWSAQRNRLPNLYTDQADGCRRFTTRPSGTFNVTYRNMVRARQEDVGRQMVYTTAWLSNGQTLTRTSTSVGPRRGVSAGGAEAGGTATD